MATVSLCMIVKNEEEVLARCLQSAAAAVEEIVIVDTGSTDATKEIARQFTDRVYDFAWIDDFAAARNFSFSKANMDYCLWLDADDVLEDPAGLALLKKDLDCDVVMMRYHTTFDTAGNPAFSYYRERLIRRAAGLRWAGAVHEAIPPKGKILYSELAVLHRKEKPADPDRNLRIYEKELAAGMVLSPRDQFYYARELSYHNRDAEAIPLLEQMVQAGEGWLENRLEACRLLAQCYQRADEPQKAVEALLRSLAWDAPRAEICCDLGDHFLERNELTTAVFWYETAVSRPRRDQRGGFVLPDRYGFYPALQLCVCHDRLGHTAKAAAWNEFAATLQPEHPAVLYNRNYFASLRA